MEDVAAGLLERFAQGWRRWCSAREEARPAPAELDVGAARLAAVAAPLRPDRRGRRGWVPARAGRRAAVKPAPFAYEEPRSVEERRSSSSPATATRPRCSPAARASIPLLNFRLARPERLVDVNRIAELAYIRRRDGMLHIGALTRMATLERSPLVAGRWPLLARGVLVSSATRRSAPRHRRAARSPTPTRPPSSRPRWPRSTRASTSARRRGTRRIAAEELFVTHLTTALEPDELLVEIDGAAAACRAAGSGVRRARPRPRRLRARRAPRCVARGAAHAAAIVAARRRPDAPCGPRRPRRRSSRRRTRPRPRRARGRAGLDDGHRSALARSSPGGRSTLAIERASA